MEQPISVKRIWREDATVHPDGRTEGGWVLLKVYEPQRAARDDYITPKFSSKRIDITHEDVERFADLYERLVIEGADDEEGVRDDQTINK